MDLYQGCDSAISGPPLFTQIFFYFFARRILPVSSSPSFRSSCKIGLHLKRDSALKMPYAVNLSGISVGNTVLDPPFLFLALQMISLLILFIFSVSCFCCSRSRAQSGQLGRHFATLSPQKLFPITSFNLASEHNALCINLCMKGLFSM